MSLYASWWALGLTMVISVASHLISYHLTERQIQRVENNESLTEDKVTTVLNYGMAASLILGITLQIIFVTINTKHMANQKENLNEIKGNTQSTPKESIIEKALPFASAPKELLAPNIEKLGLPVQNAPKAISAQGNNNNTGSTKK